MGLMTVDEPFLPFPTMFKLSHPDSSTVECVACGAMFPLEDLLSGELEEDECPHCMENKSTYWARRPHRKDT